MKILYNIGIHIYGGLLSVAALFNTKARLLRKGQKSALKTISEKRIGGDYIWFHAASLGEFEQGRPVMEELKRENPEQKILLTFYSPSGYEVRKNYAGADIIVYLPLDTTQNAKKLIRLVRPSKAVFVKYEFWPNFIEVLNTANIPIYSISSIFRPDQLFFKKYGKWYLNLLRAFKHIFVQDAASFELLKKYGINNVSVCGDTRFDRVYALSKQAKDFPLIAQFVANQRAIVAGSSWAKDEDLLIEYYLKHPQTKLIIVPHEIHKAHLEEIERKLSGKCLRYTNVSKDNILTYNCLIIDTIGMLSSIYQYADIAYVGGGFGVGIHNTLEAAVWSVPVVFGPNYQKFREARELIAVGGGFSVAGYAEFEKTFDKLFKDNKAGEAAGNYVKENIGATTGICKWLVK